MLFGVGEAGPVVVRGEFASYQGHPLAGAAVEFCESWCLGGSFTVPIMPVLADVTEASSAVSRRRAEVCVTHLDDPLLWGEPVSDERYLLVSPR